MKRISLVPMIILWMLLLKPCSSHGFDFNTTFPERVDTYPGENITITGTFFYEGSVPLKEINFSAESPFDITLKPGYIENFYNKTRSIALAVSTPEDAFGIHEIRIITTATALFSDSTLEKTKTILLGLKPLPYFYPNPIRVPEQVFIDEEFPIDVKISNHGTKEETVNVSLTVTDSWQYYPGIYSLSLRQGQSSIVSFNITPSEDSGDLSIKLLYPYKDGINEQTRFVKAFEPISKSKKPVTGLAMLISVLKISGILFSIMIIVIVLYIRYG